MIKLDTKAANRFFNSARYSIEMKGFAQQALDIWFSGEPHLISQRHAQISLLIDLGILANEENRSEEKAAVATEENQVWKEIQADRNARAKYMDYVVDQVNNLIKRVEVLEQSKRRAPGKAPR